MLLYAWLAGRAEVENAPVEVGPHDSGLHFREVAQEVGIDFVHEPTTVDGLVSAIASQITAVGAAVSVADVNGDGLPDLYAVTSATGGKNALYINRGDGTFDEVAESAGLDDLNNEEDGCCMGSVWADYDSDGLLDVFIYKWGQSQLFRNEGGLVFRDVTESAGLTGWMNASAATWFDYDRDGVLDLYVAGYFSEEHDLWNLETTKIMHDSFEFSRNGGMNRLYRGIGGGELEDVTESMGVGTRRWTYAAVAADFDRDGWPDLYLGNDYGPEELYLNREGQRFELAEDIGLESESKSGMCVALGDVWGKGSPCVYVTNISKRGYLFQGNNLRVSLLESGGPMMQIADGVETDCGWAWGAQFADLDRNGLQDLVVVNGFVSASKERDYWYQMSKIGLANGSVIADAAQWPEFGDRSLSGYERTRVMLNSGRSMPFFSEVGAEVGVTDVYDGRAVAVADLFGTGRLDIIVANQNGPLLVYKNEGQDDFHWISFDLVGQGKNWEAIGAEVELYYGERRQLQVVTTAVGFASQNQRRLYFGVGEDAGPLRATVRWPSGQTQELDGLTVDRVHELEEPE